MNNDTKRPTIVVGVSATSKSPTALRWAVEQAVLLDGRVVAVRAWRPLLPGTASRGTPAVATPDLAAAEAAERESLAADVVHVLGHDHPVEAKLIHGSKASALLEAAQGADLIVIDTPPRTDLSTPPWFVDRLIHRAPCPVVIMPPALARRS